MNMNNQTDLKLVFERQNKTVIRDGIVFKLDPIIARLFEYFLTQPDIVITRQALATNVWETAYASDDAVNRAISRLRKILGEPREQFITTIPKIGYQFSAVDSISIIEASTETSSEASVETSSETSSEASVETSVETSAETSSETVIAANDSTPSRRFFGRRSWSLNKKVLLAAVLAIAVLLVVAGQMLWPNADLRQDNQLLVMPFELRNDGIITADFVAGLHDETLHGFSSISSLQVKDGQKLLAANDPKTPWSEQAPASRYLLEGCMHADKHQIRVNARLHDLSTGKLLFSVNIVRPLTQLLASQTEISKQLAAALRLALVHQRYVERYADARKHLDPASVEQLVKSRNLLDQKSLSMTSKAVRNIDALALQYPDNAEVLGAQAYSHCVAYRRGYGNSSLDSRVALAQHALSLEPANSDALQALFCNYETLPEYRQSSFAAAEALIRYHPDQQASWRALLYLMTQTAMPCEQIRTKTIDAMPLRFFSQDERQIFETIIDTCLNGQSVNLLGIRQLISGQTVKLDTQPMSHRPVSAGLQDTVFNNILLFNLNSDLWYEAVRYKQVVSPNAFYTLQQFNAQLMKGNIEEAKETLQLFDKLPANQRWLAMAALYAQLHGLKNDTLPLFNDDPNPYAGFIQPIQVTAMVNKYQHKAEAVAQSAFKNYLQKTADFLLNIDNRNEALALMIAQYHAGSVVLSSQTAKILYYKLENYRLRHPQSYRFWGLARAQLISRFYCQRRCDTVKLTPMQLLEKGFRPGEVWWLHDLAFTKAALSPWAEDVAVLEYLKRITLDIQRVKSKI